MPVEITMPQQTDTMTEGTVVKWLKREGEKVKAGEIIAEIETDKAVMETEAFEAGTLAHVAAKEGAKVPVGGLIAVLATGKDDPAAVKKQYAAAAGSGGEKKPATAQQQQSPQPQGSQQQPPARQPQAQPAGQSRPSGGGAEGGWQREHVGPWEHTSPNAAKAVERGAVKPSTMSPLMDIESDQEASGTGGAVRSIDHPQFDMAAAMHPVHSAVRHDGRGGAGDNGHGEGNGQRGNAREGRRTFASPLARRIAAERGIDLSQIQGSGPGGRIIRRDVMAFAERGPSAAAPAPAEQKAADKGAAPALPTRVPRGQTEAVPLTKMRSAIATALQRSKQQVPHFYVTADVDVEELVALRARLNKQLEAGGVKVSLNDFVSKAAAAALLRYPALNAHWKDDQIVRFGDVNLGIAVAIPEGLIVPVLRGADQMGLKELQVRTAELAKKAKAQRLKGDEMKGATFTISNLGMYGVKDFAAIINPPEVAILAVAAAEKRPVVRGDQIVARTVMSLTLSVDHRAVDGATAAEFLRTLKSLLEEPGMMLV